ncbi:hypothetical protein AK812_SmicGene22019 [Symbiodinium microadriaticum]|uniref:Uncharacterized protein n=1 Tax=Symbiodinium microadriaticum TaxID=2951 RepID=A0A1Q9DKV6_SYMMI|nr:hypothetical protein AK812_SmicGene22019 [Symbiodinium microadriaticum]
MLQPSMTGDCTTCKRGQSRQKECEPARLRPSASDAGSASRHLPDWSLRPDQQGLLVSGTPLGSDAFVQRLLELERAEHDKLLMRIPAVEDLQAAWLLYAFALALGPTTSSACCRLLPPCLVLRRTTAQLTELAVRLARQEMGKRRPSNLDEERSVADVGTVVMCDPRRPEDTADDQIPGDVIPPREVPVPSARLPATIVRWRPALGQAVIVIDRSVSKKNFESRVEALLKSFGYLGNGSGTPPHVAELKEKLAELESRGALAHSTALFDGGLLDADATEIDEDDAGGCEASLPPDMKRGGVALYLDLFNQASLVDFAVKDARGSQAQALSLIARSDTAEVALRRLASYVREKRTGDRDAAVSMLAIKPTNLSHDIAPARLVSAMVRVPEVKRRARKEVAGGEVTNAPAARRAEDTADDQIPGGVIPPREVPAPSARLSATTVRWRPALGQAVIVIDTPPYQDFKDELGAVASVHDSGLVDIALCNGAVLYQVPGTSLKIAQLRGDEPECEQLARLSSKALESDQGKGASLSEAKHATYAPLSMAAIEATQSQARIVKNLLVKWSARAALIPSWSRSFWKEVGEQGKFESRVETLLKSFGYLGNGSGTPPRVAELKEKLAELESSGALAHSTALFDGGLLDADATEIDEDDAGGWEASLPPDMKRAGPEIYASFRASGARSAREWLNQMIPLDRRGDALYLDLFNQASLVDFAVKDARGSQAQALSLIARSDTAEVALRRLASYVHEKRTGDRDAAVSMLAIKPTNLSHDIAPAWLVSEAALFAQGEHKRRERAKAQRGDGKGSGGQAKGSKGGGRGRGDKRPKGGKVPPTGGQPAVAALVKSAKVDAMGYATVSKTHAQVPMDASRIVEPSDERVVDMLQALPQDER